VAAVRAETPGTGGRLGVGMRRDVGTVREGGSPAYVAALNEVVIAVMVEKRECVEDLDAILSVKGLDMVQFGASR
jgi:2-keto-3-deoxy-L-rhamnonate aldolase RhmA